MLFDDGKAPIVDELKQPDAIVPRNAFNMSRVHSFQGIIGALMPFDILETIPNEDYTISYDTLALTRNPLVRRLQNGFTLYIHTYWCAKKDLWRGYKVYYDKGRSGKVVKTVPKYYPSCNSSGIVANNGTPLDHADNDYTFLTPFSPLGFMGVPAVCYNKQEENVNKWFLPTKIVKSGENKNIINNGYGTDQAVETKWGINALPLVMYAKIYRDYYANQNILGKNNNWFHENDDEDLILEYDCPEWINTANGELNSYDLSQFDSESEMYVPKGEDEKNTKVYLNCLYFRQFKGDYFTTANIFKDMMRGDKEELSNLSINAEEAFWEDEFPYEKSILGAAWGDGESKFLTFQNTNGGVVTAPSLAENFKKAFEKIKINSQLTLNALRKAVVMEKLMMRSATTNGTYKEFIGAMFGYYPNENNRKPRYVGGTYQPIVFNEVVQTGASEEGKPLGTTASRGMSASSGYIGKFHSDDHGYLMSIMSIVPDTYYNTQSLETLWNRTEQDKEYIPILNNLEPQPIKNKEIYISGIKEYDEDVWGYAPIYEDMKHRRNIITGLGALGDKAVFDSSTFMKRTFNNLNKPTLSQSWLTMSVDNIDMTPFTSKNEPVFDIMVGCNIDKVSPMPYGTETADMGIKF